MQCETKAGEKNAVWNTDSLKSKFVNNLMQHGKKSLAEKIFNDMLARIKETELSAIKKSQEKNDSKSSDAAEAEPKAATPINVDACEYLRLVSPDVFR